MIIEKRKAIFGIGGLARELYFNLEDKDVDFFVDDNFYNNDIFFENKTIKPINQFNPSNYFLIVAIGDPIKRNTVIKRLPLGTKFWSFIHPSITLNQTIKIGCGAIILQNSILTTSITIGDFSVIHSFSVIAHDVVIGNFFTSGYGVKISGSVKIGDNVFLGTNSAIKQEICIVDNVVVGLSSAVVKNIDSSGTFVGIPAKKISSKINCF
jgi:sugar O-acyltransferase (sialic acid O-acetyltransferase NeuD family)